MMRQWDSIHQPSGFYSPTPSVAFPCGSVIKTPPAKQNTWVWSLGQEDPLEKEKAVHSSILAWKIPWTEKPSKATVHGVCKESDMTEWLNNNNTLFQILLTTSKSNALVLYNNNSCSRSGKCFKKICNRFRSPAVQRLVIIYKFSKVTTKLPPPLL